MFLSPILMNDALHTRDCLFWMSEQPCLVCQHEHLRQVRPRADFVKTPNHAEVLLVPIEICQKDHTCLVVVGRGLENMAGKQEPWRAGGFLLPPLAPLSGPAPSPRPRPALAP